jgi:hypothetical protein
MGEMKCILSIFMCAKVTQVSDVAHGPLVYWSFKCENGHLGISLMINL